ncbi:hypothetical protein DFH27DRAFT_522553 [Peziza echinospora]|nr:hypothetical protein DFH27DRAFT_522553 [Peziza echinospora]
MAKTLGQVDWAKDVCIMTNHMTAVQDNKIYQMGGNAIVLVNNTYVQVTDSYLRIIDFTKGQIDLSDASNLKITTAKRLPTQVPLVKWGQLFASPDRKVRLFGGIQEYFSVFDAAGAIVNTTRAAINGRLPTYDIDSDAWDDGTALSGFSDDDTVTRGAVAVGDDGTAWLYGGAVETSNYLEGTVMKGKLERKSLSKAVVKFEPGQKPSMVLQQSPILPADQSNLLFVGGVGKAGILVAVGGAQANSVTRPMTSVDVFDIETKTWFTQPTTADKGNAYPPERQEGCAVIASAPDKSSHNIYLYGGWVVGAKRFSDIYVLSLPAFHWVNVGGTPLDYARAHHRCEVVHNKFMVSSRGSNDGNYCDKYQGIQLYDMTALSWITKLDTTVKHEYTVPQLLYKVIGGDANGGANFTSPKAGWIDDDLGAIFKAASATTTTSPSGTSTGIGSNLPDTTGGPGTEITNSKSKSNTGPIVGGVVGGIAALIILAVIILLVRKRRKQNAASEAHPGANAFEADSSPVQQQQYYAPHGHQQQQQQQQQQQHMYPPNQHYASPTSPQYSSPTSTYGTTMAPPSELGGGYTGEELQGSKVVDGTFYAPSFGTGVMAEEEVVRSREAAADPRSPNSPAAAAPGTYFRS